MKSNNSKSYIYLSSRTVVTFIVCIGTTQSAFAVTCQQVDDKLAASYQSIVDNSHYSGEFNDSKFNSAHANFDNALVQYVKLSDSLSCGLSKAQNAGVSVVTSTDNKLRAISWDMMTGGTLREFTGLIQYQGSRSYKTKFDILNEDVISLNTIIIPDSSDNSTTNHRTLYLMSGFSVGSSIMHGQNVHIYEIANNGLNQPNLIQTASRKTNYLGFGYDASSLNENMSSPLIKIDSSEKSITFPIIINTKTYPFGKVTNRSIKYRYENKFFRKVIP